VLLRFRREGQYDEAGGVGINAVDHQRFFAGESFVGREQIEQGTGHGTLHLARTVRN